MNEAEVNAGFTSEHDAIVCAERHGWVVFRTDGGSGHYVAAQHRWDSWESGGWQIHMMELVYVPRSPLHWRWHVVIRCVPRKIEGR